MLSSILLVLVGQPRAKEVLWFSELWNAHICGMFTHVYYNIPCGDAYVVSACGLHYTSYNPSVPLAVTVTTGSKNCFSLRVPLANW